MTTTHSLNATNLLSTRSDIKETINSKSVAISGINLIAGLLLLASSNWIEDKTSGLYLFTIFSPFMLLVFALIHFSCKRKHLVYAATNSPINCGQLYFDKSQMDIVKAMLKSDSTENIEWSGFKKTGNARLDYMVSKDTQFVAVQLYEYVPYNYEVASEIFFYTGAPFHPLGQLLLQTHPRD